ncbi:helix-turn-helix transcriptional regulator [Neogemmobacter tilapiae]|uniref:Transcriptional regulator n=1 Tax=Neogemmobacter tilapiae TaxID=875041 RepID=A0A918WQV0_9RHOB|nr:helix-turn-helix transcriptional regulator [Gemmobacter tilapiae]GHC65672.1 transcriptional regulator [Gemmobacter tilapiae]
MSLQNRLRDIRTQRGETQADLAGALGVSRQTVISLEGGRYAPSLELALKIAGHYGQTVESLFWLAPDAGLA